MQNGKMPAGSWSDSIRRQRSGGHSRWNRHGNRKRAVHGLRDNTQKRRAAYILRVPSRNREHAEAEGSLAEAERLHASIEELLRSLEMSQGGAEGQSQTGGVELAAARTESQPFLQMEVIHGAEARQAELEEQYRIERAEWDSACLELKRLRAEAEWNCAEMARQRASLESALIEKEARDGDTEITNQAESADWEKKRQEWEQQQASLMGTIGGLEQRLAENAEQHQIERAEWDSAWLRLKGQLAESEAKRAELESLCAALEERLRAVDARSSEIDDRYRSEQTAWEATRQHWEQQHHEAEEQRAALEAVIRGLEARQAELVHQHRTERAEWERARAELERQKSESDSRRAELENRRAMHEEVLHALETRCAELELQYQSELAGLEKIQRELEEREREVEERRIGLETMVTGLEARLEESKHQHRAEQDEWQSARLELERQRSVSEGKRSELESRCASLEAALHALEARSAELERSTGLRLRNWRRRGRSWSSSAGRPRNSGQGSSRWFAGSKRATWRSRNSIDPNLPNGTAHARNWNTNKPKSDGKRAELEGRRTALEEALHALEARCAETRTAATGAALPESAKMQPGAGAAAPGCRGTAGRPRVDGSRARSARPRDPGTASIGTCRVGPRAPGPGTATGRSGWQTGGSGSAAHRAGRGSARAGGALRRDRAAAPVGAFGIGEAATGACTAAPGCRGMAGSP